MTVEEANRSEPTLRERTVGSFMGGDKAKGTPSNQKRQTSLLSFFSSPSPKRPTPTTESIRHADQHESPTKRKNPNELLLMQTSSFYEMVSEEETETLTEDATQIEGPTRARPTVPTRVLPTVPTRLPSIALGSFRLDELSSSEIVSSGSSGSSLRKCHYGNIVFAEDEDKSCGPDGKESSNERYSWLTNIRDAEGHDPSTGY